MLPKRAATFFAVFLTSLFGNACAPKQTRVAQVEICLVDSVGVEHFKREMQDIAGIYQLDYLDASMKTKGEFENITKRSGPFRHSSFVLNLGIERADGLGATAMDMDTPDYLAAIGFTSGKNVTEGQLFAQEVIKRLKAHWRLRTVSLDIGVQPTLPCGQAKVGQQGITVPV